MPRTSRSSGCWKSGLSASAASECQPASTWAPGRHEFITAPPPTSKRRQGFRPVSVDEPNAGSTGSQGSRAWALRQSSPADADGQRESVAYGSMRATARLSTLETEHGSASASDIVARTAAAAAEVWGVIHRMIIPATKLLACSFRRASFVATRSPGGAFRFGLSLGMSTVVTEPLDLVRLSLDERIVVSRHIPANIPPRPG